jgi:riboflavin synthase
VFTGLIQDTGEIAARRGDRVGVRAARMKGLDGGESVAVNGVCLTLEEEAGGLLWFFLSQETLACSSASLWLPGTPANLERPLTLQGWVGGHLVQGHIDATGRVVRALGPRGSVLRVGYPAEHRMLLVEKGSVAVHGVSLTVAALLPGSVLEAAVVPETARRTVLPRLKAGQAVHLEFDLVGKYVAQWMRRP